MRTMEVTNYVNKQQIITNNFVAKKALINLAIKPTKKMLLLKFGWYMQLEECSMIRQSERIQIYSQSSQTPLTDCFTLTGSSEGNLKQHTALQRLFLYNECTTKI